MWAAVTVKLHLFYLQRHPSCRSLVSERRSTFHITSHRYVFLIYVFPEVSCLTSRICIIIPLSLLVYFTRAAIDILSFRNFLALYLVVHVSLSNGPYVNGSMYRFISSCFYFSLVSLYFLVSIHIE